MRGHRGHVSLYNDVQNEDRSEEGGMLASVRIEAAMLRRVIVWRIVLVEAYHSSSATTSRANCVALTLHGRLALSLYSKPAAGGGGQVSSNEVISD